MFRNRIHAWVTAAVLAWLTTAAPALAETPPEDLVAQARVAAAQDRHGDAIQHYLAAIRSQPALRSDVSMELGDQYTWADMPDSAIAWYEYYLLGHPDNMDAKLGLARALAWSDQLEASESYYESLVPEAGERRGEVMLGLARVRSWRDNLGGAEKAYRDVLEQDPDNLDAKLGLAQVTNWSGRHREAEAMYREVLAEEAGNAEAVEGLAYAQAWQGMNEQAIATLEGSDDTARAARTAADLGREGRVTGHHTYGYRDNTTDGDFQFLRSEFRAQPKHLTEIGVAYTRGGLDQPGFPWITRDELMFIFRQRFSPLLEVNANPGYQWNRFDRILVPPNTQQVNDFSFMMWDAYVTLTPRDWLRFDVGNSRASVDIPRPIFLQIHVTTTTIGMDWRLSRRVSSSLGLRFSNFSDSNRRRISAAQVDYTTPLSLPTGWRNQFILTGDIAYWDTDKETNNGYFSPLTYTQLGARLRWVGDIGRRTTIDVAGRLGSEKEKSDPWASVGSFQGSVRYRVAGDVFLRAGYGTSGSRLDAPDGFRAKNFFVSIDYLISR